jgi:subtilase family serine protease
LPKLSTFNLSTLIIFILVLSALSFAAPPDRITGTIALHGQRAPWALPENSQGPVPGDLTLEHLTVVLKRSPQQQQAFELFLQQLQDRTSPNYHHFLTPIQIGQRFGASQTDIGAVSEWLRAQGLRVDSVANSRMMIDFSGTASLVGAAFATEMRYYEVNGERRIAAADDPQIPAALANVIQSVSGLYTIHNRPYHVMGQARKVEGGGFILPAGTFCNPGCINVIFPADFATIYDLNSVTVDGTGQNIGIIGRSRVYDPDIENFQTQSALAIKDPTVIIPPLGVDPGPPDGTVNPAPDDQGEATLDVTRSTSIAPGATIDLIVSASTETQDGVQIATEYAVDTSPVPAPIMSISFGSCENPTGGGGGLSEDQYWDSLFSQAAGEGISVFVAAGDAGAAGCDDYFAQPPATQVLSINSICASSYVTCVGGTEFADAADPALYWNQNPVQAPPFESALGPIPEGGWNEPSNGSGGFQTAAGGGGFSLYIPTPSWQTGPGVPGTQGRYNPDVAFSSSGATAQPHDGYFGCLAADGGSCVVQDGGFSFLIFSGTSAAAPDMAGITALLNQQEQAPQGELNQRLYELAAVTPTNNVFNDVTVATSGVSPCAVTTPSMCNNSTPSPTALTGGLAGYLVTAGYDEVTGLGSINGATLLANWVAVTTSATTTTVVSSQNPANLGVSVTFTATVTTVGTNPPTGTVTFNDSGTAIGTGTLATVAGAQVATFATSTLTVGTHSITATYGGDANNSASTSSPPLSQVIAAPTFHLSTPTTPAPALAGESTTSTFIVTATGGATTFAEAVTFACNLPSGIIGVTCSFSPTQIAAGASSPQTITLTITTTGPNTSTGANRRRRADNRSPWLPLALPLAGILMVGFAGRKKSKYSAIAGLGVSLALLGLLVACGSNNTPPVAVSVSLASGSSASVFPNDAADSWPTQQAQFTATVTNTSNTAVTWSLSSSTSCTATPSPCGSISATGLYMAPTVAAGLPASVTVTATSVADTTKSGSATETITPATIPGTYNITVTATEGPTTNTTATIVLTVN